ncbi:hypothetical protein QFC19_008305 [Naganishia cerealis]|uniref:Uncharacterized protein n=1 Tax=Naganishia cerealis TaxID=610337 RepID=A0ACC2V3I1_9TREE|nr:hypothetical protein QFC19_008305 [Naganishia cerealis]
MSGYTQNSLPSQSSQNVAQTSRDDQTSVQQLASDDPPRNRNSRIYAETSEHMLGMGNRELDNQDEELETDYAGTEGSCDGSDADVTAKDIGLFGGKVVSDSDTLTPSASYNDRGDGNGNIPRSPRIDWSASTND